jgi:phenylacetyl-CoA:acceptor oxidoreductase subunit 2
MMRMLAPLSATIALVAVGATVLRGWAWHTYRQELEDNGAPRRALAVLAAFGPWFFALGLALPAAFIAAAFVAALFAAAHAASPLFALAGICICFAGSAMKFILVTRAGYNQGFALTHTPVRGSGFAGPAVKPGWSTP